MDDNVKENALSVLESWILSNNSVILDNFHEIQTSGIEITEEWKKLYEFWLSLKQDLSNSCIDDEIEIVKINHDNGSLNEKIIPSGLKRKRKLLRFPTRKKKPTHTKYEDSREKASHIFSWMISNVDVKQFMDEYWEKDFLHVKRNNSQYYKKVLSTVEIDRILRKNYIMFTKNIDITTYINGVRKTHNPEGRAYASTVWDLYSTGASVRFLNPQTYSNPVWKICEGLQDAFGCFVGANVYLTPPGTQGFAPHYDDIEAFVLQLEGKKRWRVYRPRSQAEECALVSSPNLSEEDLEEPDLDVVLEAGDLLYFPRGFIHQANALPDVHSLHITVSSFQNNSWANFLEQAVPAALKIATSENPEFRRGLPLDYLSYMGLVHSDNNDIQKMDLRKLFREKARFLMDFLADMLPLDSAADQMGKKLIHDALPPILSHDERVRTIYNGGEHWEDNDVVNRVEITPDTKIRFLKANIARLIMEEDEIRLYFSTENSREYHELFPEEPPYLVIESHLAPGVEQLILSYPRFMSVSKLALEDLTSKISGIQLYSSAMPKGNVCGATK
ncbi:hypothetical protein QYM36_014639 [Artemia franciscana]|uniref:Bifunctional lysine-specific demethylase and histidyl-hydroxylase n=1 Tax=Artemia franciscana TaxID=6661 RepID=A0AA88H7E9_ARTSF|nr:hypothetical protein QYM36_014639 [Artemia franciscana]KAK2706656.1 hypothetical protein QYM36_014639 [Artemia franciscana]KAK2706658.1 hypothetical protein QYM36_014639 [Artemia franciscana]KAK2706659.1 hypothetical protein QYM36_014639 [Artemia franciscana]KAK2706660.1 hypothetical protein QYM36_014639 [Artemia franciscana]